MEQNLNTVFSKEQNIYIYFYFVFLNLFICSFLKQPAFLSGVLEGICAVHACVDMAGRQQYDGRMSVQPEKEQGHLKTRHLFHYCTQ